MAWWIWAFAVYGWFWVGHKGFVFWWTTEWDYTTDERPIAWALSALGPLTWLMGAAVHGGGGRTRTLVEARQRRES